MAVRYEYPKLWTLIRDGVALEHPDLRDADMSLVIADLGEDGLATVGLIVAGPDEDLDTLDRTFPDPYGRLVQPMRQFPAASLETTSDGETGPVGWPLCHGSSGQEWERAHDEMARNDKLWQALAFDGVQSHGKDGLRENRRCPSCGSTFSRPVSPQAACELLSAQAALHSRSLEALTSAPLLPGALVDRRAA